MALSNVTNASRLSSFDKFITQLNIVYHTVLNSFLINVSTYYSLFGARMKMVTEKRPILQNFKNMSYSYKTLTRLRDRNLLVFEIDYFTSICREWRRLICKMSWAKPIHYRVKYFSLLRSSVKSFFLFRDKKSFSKNNKSIQKSWTASQKKRFVRWNIIKKTKRRLRYIRNSKKKHRLIGNLGT